MSDFNEKQKYTDVKFICVDNSDSSGKASIGAHQIVLSLASDVFETMFYGSLAKKCRTRRSTDKGTEAEYCVEITDIEINIFQMMLSFIYNIKIQFADIEEACAFYYAVYKYNVKDAIDDVSRFLSKNLNPENAIYIYETTLPFEDTELQQTFYKVLALKVNEILSCASFLNAKPETVELIFGRKELNIDSEMVLVNALKRYIDENTKTDNEISVKVRPALESIRFLTLSSDILCKDVYDTGLLSLEEIVNITACLPPQTDLSKMPEGFSLCSKQRDFYRKQYMIRELSEVFTNKMCIHCSKRAELSNHAIWYCSHSHILKQQLLSIYQKYNHVSLIEYDNQDLITIFNIFQKKGYVSVQLPQK